VLRHNHIYDYDGACVGEVPNYFSREAQLARA